MSQRRTVAFLVKGFPRISETFVLHEFLELRRQGVSLRLLAVLDPEEKTCHEEAEPLLAEVTHLRGVGVAQQASAIAHAVIRHPLGVARALRWLAIQRSRPALRRVVDAAVLVAICDREEIRHVHAHFASVPTTTAYVASRIAPISYSFTGHAKDVYTTAPEALALRVGAARAVVTCTDANRHYFEETVGVTPGAVRVLRHGIPLGSFLAVARTPEPGLVLTVGRLVPKKGHDTVLRAIALLVGEGRDVRWRVVGTGPERDALVALADELRIRERVVLVGRCTAEEVRDELARAAVFALASRVLADGDRDGIPNVLLEAMAAGVPLVASAVSGVPEVVRDGYSGLLVEPDDASSFARAIARTLDDPDATLARVAHARDFAIGECDLTRSVEPLAIILRDLAEGPA